VNALVRSLRPRTSGRRFDGLGYAAISGRTGICSVTHGPAMVNTATALAHGVKGSFADGLALRRHGRRGSRHTQKIAQREFVLAAGAGFEQLRSPRTVAEDVARVLRRAIAERRPVALNLPHESIGRMLTISSRYAFEFPKAAPSSRRAMILTMLLEYRRRQAPDHPGWPRSDLA